MSVPVWGTPVLVSGSYVPAAGTSVPQGRPNGGTSGVQSGRHLVPPPPPTILTNPMKKKVVVKCQGHTHPCCCSVYRGLLQKRRQG